MATVTKTSPAFDEVEHKLAYFRAAQYRRPSDSVETGDDRITPEPVSEGRAKMASAGIRYFSDVIKQLNELRAEAEEDDFGVLQATEHAYETACQLVTDAAILAACGGRQIPRGRASTDAEGGVRIDWMRPDAAVCLIVPASKVRDPYIYHDVAGNFATDPATDSALSRWLREIP